MLKHININFTVAIYVIYIVLVALNINGLYFWDNIAITSKEAHFFFEGSSNVPFYISKQPFIGVITAGLWLIFGYELWVSPIFILFVSFFLIYNTQKLVKLFLTNNRSEIIVFLLLTEPTIFSQIIIASPDILLLSMFVFGLRSLVEKRKLFLVISILVLGLISTRGMFVSAILSFVFFIDKSIVNGKSGILKSLFEISYVFVVLCISVCYNIFLLNVHKWEVVTPEYSSHYLLPNSFIQILRHAAEFGLRLFENGRFMMFIFAGIILFKIVKYNLKLKQTETLLLMFFVLHAAIYVVFIFISSMPFSARYFMPFYFSFSVLTLVLADRILNVPKKRIFFALIFIFQITGHFWVYPDKIAKSWDCTLAHYPYYELREQCFSYIDQKGISYSDLSGGFCFYSDRKYFELNNKGKFVNTDMNRAYFIYSNISNLTDNEIESLSDKSKWQSEKRFYKWPVEIVLYKKIQ